MAEDQEPGAPPDLAVGCGIAARGVASRAHVPTCSPRAAAGGRACRRASIAAPRSPRRCPSIPASSSDCASDRPTRPARHTSPRWRRVASGASPSDGPVAGPLGRGADDARRGRRDRTWCRRLSARRRSTRLAGDPRGRPRPGARRCRLVRLRAQSAGDGAPAVTVSGRRRERQSGIHGDGARTGESTVRRLRRPSRRRRRAADACAATDADARSDGDATPDRLPRSERADDLHGQDG